MDIFETYKQFLLNVVTSDYFIGAVSLLFILIFLKIWFKKHWLSITSSKLGKVRMSKHALYEVVYGICKDIDGIIHPHIKLTIKRKKINIDINIKLGICKNLSSITVEIQNKLNEVLVNDLGLSNVGKINVIVSGFSRRSCRANDKFISECSCSNKNEEKLNVE